jgi:DNA-binding CsgD family transcriptional regulator
MNAGDQTDDQIDPRARARSWLTPRNLVTRTEIDAEFDRLERESRHVDIMVKDSFPFDTAEPTLRRMLEAGARIRCIYEEAMRDHPEGKSYLSRWRELGEQQRFVDSLPFRAAVFDRATVLVPVASRADSVVSLLVIEAGLGEVIADKFEFLWHQRSDTDSSPSVTRQELDILTLMCQGVSDYKIAKTLGIGVRTVQRRLGELATVFHAASRPALAARVVAMGLVTPVVDPRPARDPGLER